MKMKAGSRKRERREPGLDGPLDQYPRVIGVD